MRVRGGVSRSDLARTRPFDRRSRQCVTSACSVSADRPRVFQHHGSPHPPPPGTGWARQHATSATRGCSSSTAWDATGYTLEPRALIVRFSLARAIEEAVGVRAAQSVCQPRPSVVMERARPPPWPPDRQGTRASRPVPRGRSRRPTPAGAARSVRERQIAARMSGKGMPIEPSRYSPRGMAMMAVTASVRP